MPLQMNLITAIRFIVFAPIIFALLGLAYCFLLYAKKIASKPSQTAIFSMMNHVDAMRFVIIASILETFAFYLAG